MRPAYSAVFFTTATGMGCGLLVLLGVFASGEMIPDDRRFGLAALGIALGAVTFGLVSSTFHPGDPERALRAFSQWRSSWLSRAAVLAAATCAPAGLFAIGWVAYGEVVGVWRFCGLAAALLAGFTVYATAMIYATQRPVHAWCNPWVLPIHLALALFTGALWLNALLALFGRASPDASMVVVVALFLSFYLKRRYWRFIDTTAAATTPHATRETGWRIAREQVARLRRYAFVLLFALPLVFTMAAMETVWIAATAAFAAAFSGSVGVGIERWLFLAEARHAATLRHGAEAA